MTAVTLCCDPGLRNLSLCVMNSNYEILVWDVYNILDSDDYKCEGVFKNGKVCGRKCNMKYKPSKMDTVFTCKTHFPKDIKATKVNDFKKKNIDDYLLQDIAKTFIDRIQEIYESDEVFKQLTSILIELQPKCNSKMVFISHILYGKFVELYKDTIPIRFVRASQKLKAYTGPEVKCNLKGAYAKRKWLSIQYAKWFLENKFSKEQRDKWTGWLERQTKCDDASDVLLYAINALHGIPKKHLRHKNGNELK
jgi:hypothetical protein